MSEMPPEAGPGAGGGLPRPLGIPVLVWVAAAAVIAYLVFFRGKGQSAGSPTTTGGGGTITTGDTTIDRGAVTVSVTQKGPAETSTTTNEDQDQPQPPGPKPRRHHGKAVAVPDVKGQRADAAISDIEAVGLEAITSPFRDPKKEYEATGTVPPAGTHVPEGTRVTIRVKALPTPRKQPVREIPGGPKR